MNSNTICSKIRNYKFPKNAKEKAERLKKLFDDFSDEIPNKIVRSGSKNPLYKVRAAWWNSAYFRVEILKNDIPSQLYDDCMNIFDSHRNYIHANGLTRKEDIEAINYSASLIFEYFDLN